MANRTFWNGRPVFLTGHTGFKGGWLATWLLDMGSRVRGYALPPETSPSFFALTGLRELMPSTVGDVRDPDRLSRAIGEAGPEVVFHLAAQPLVRRSYRDPVETFQTNVIGTLNVLEAVRRNPTVRAVVVVTSDKCYQNHESARGYREEDPLGGDDPYSASKACAEIVANTYRRSYFGRGDVAAGLATARAGNVIGGGDWSEDRLVPDAVRALQAGRPVIVRNPRAVRPWQHVLEPLEGYLRLAERLVERPEEGGGCWNFGPDESDEVPVGSLVERFVRAWGGGSWKAEAEAGGPRETNRLKLDSGKARRILGWAPRWNLEEAVGVSVTWYRKALAAASPADAHGMSRDQIGRYEEAVAGRGAS